MSALLVVLIAVGLLGSALFIALFFALLSTLIECPECSRRTPRREPTCRHCGNELSRRESVH